eukprot:908965-Prorocentrum_minimum.AAC.1
MFYTTSILFKFNFAELNLETAGTSPLPSPCRCCSPLAIPSVSAPSAPPSRSSALHLRPLSGCVTIATIGHLLAFSPRRRTLAVGSP